MRTNALRPLSQFPFATVRWCRCVQHNRHCSLWHYRLWSFKTRDTKLERFLHKNQRTQRELLNFENWASGEPQQLAKIRQIFRQTSQENNESKLYKEFIRAYCATYLYTYCVLKAIREKCKNSKAEQKRDRGCHNANHQTQSVLHSGDFLVKLSV